MSGRLLEKHALVIGINSYADPALELRGALPDAVEMSRLLGADWNVIELHDRDADIDFDILERHIRALLGIRPDSQTDVDLLLYFSGHATDIDGDICLQAFDRHGTSFSQLMRWVNAAAGRARTVTVILDCCYSGALASRANPDPFILSDQAVIPENVTLLTATAKDQEAKELFFPQDGRFQGRFTNSLLGGLNGAAADLIGEVTPLSLYSHASAALAGVDQRPTLKAHVSHSAVLRTATPRITLRHLSHLGEIFDGRDFVELTWFHEGLKEGMPGWHEGEDAGSLDRESDGHRQFGGSEKQRELDYLKRFRDAGLVASEDGRDFFFVCTRAPVEGQSRRVLLTALGTYYRDLAVAGLLRSGDDFTAVEQGS